VTQEESESARSPLFLAAHWLSMGRPERSLEVLSGAGDAVVEDPDAYVIKAAALLEMGRDVDATAAARDGLGLDPEHVGLLELLATARWRLDDHAGAEQAFLEALRRRTEDPVLLARYALLVAQEGQVEKAGRLLGEAARIDPDEATVDYVSAVVAYLQGDDSEAARRGQELLRADPEHADAHAFLGRLDFEHGRTARAGEHLRRAASLEPDSATHRYAAREARFVNHPALRPLRAVVRFGPGKVWIAAIVVVFGLRAAGLETVATIAALVYLAFALYSWVAPPIVRRWVRRRT
jgi:tetratricopeptide (TPR) repeat protein